MASGHKCPRYRRICCLAERVAPGLTFPVDATQILCTSSPCSNWCIQRLLFCGMSKQCLVWILLLLGGQVTYACTYPSQPLTMADGRWIRCVAHDDACPPGYKCRHLWLEDFVCCSVLKPGATEAPIRPLLNVIANHETFRDSSASQRAAQSLHQQEEDVWPPLLPVERPPRLDAFQELSDLLSVPSDGRSRLTETFRAHQIDSDSRSTNFLQPSTKGKFAPVAEERLTKPPRLPLIVSSIFPPGMESTHTTTNITRSSKPITSTLAPSQTTTLHTAAKEPSKPDADRIVFADSHNPSKHTSIKQIKVTTTTTDPVTESVEWTTTENREDTTENLPSTVTNENFEPETNETQILLEKVVSENNNSTQGETTATTTSQGRRKAKTEDDSKSENTTLLFDSENTTVITTTHDSKQCIIIVQSKESDNATAQHQRKEPSIDSKKDDLSSTLSTIKHTKSKTATSASVPISKSTKATQQHKTTGTKLASTTTTTDTSTTDATTVENDDDDSAFAFVPATQEAPQPPPQGPKSRVLITILTHKPKPDVQNQSSELQELIASEATAITKKLASKLTVRSNTNESYSLSVTQQNSPKSVLEKATSKFQNIMMPPSPIILPASSVAENTVMPPGVIFSNSSDATTDAAKIVTPISPSPKVNRRQNTKIKGSREKTVDADHSQNSGNFSREESSAESSSNATLRFFNQTTDNISLSDNGRTPSSNFRVQNRSAEETEQDSTSTLPEVTSSGVPESDFPTSTTENLVTEEVWELEDDHSTPTNLIGTMMQMAMNNPGD